MATNLKIKKWIDALIFLSDYSRYKFLENNMLKIKNKMLGKLKYHVLELDKWLKYMTTIKHNTFERIDLNYVYECYDEIFKLLKPIDLKRGKDFFAKYFYKNKEV